MNLVIDSETLDQIVLTARVLHARLTATMPGRQPDVDSMVAASMPAIITLATTENPPDAIDQAAARDARKYRESELDEHEGH